MDAFGLFGKVLPHPLPPGNSSGQKDKDFRFFFFSFIQWTKKKRKWNEGEPA